MELFEDCKDNILIGDLEVSSTYNQSWFSPVLSRFSPGSLQVLSRFPSGSHEILLLVLWRKLEPKSCVHYGVKLKNNINRCSMYLLFPTLFIRIKYRKMSPFEAPSFELSKYLQGNVRLTQ